MFKIEKDHPESSINHKPTGQAAKGKKKYPFSTMEVGDSFLVDDQELFSSVRACSHQYGTRHCKKFSCRSTEGGLRVTRVE